jgi:hypothetical protein
MAAYREGWERIFRPTPIWERSERFNDTTGCLSWNYRSAAEHPDRCVCQGDASDPRAATPHKHYRFPPHACARCACEAYVPACAESKVGA